MRTGVSLQFERCKWFKSRSIYWSLSWIVNNEIPNCSLIVGYHCNCIVSWHGQKTTLTELSLIIDWRDVSMTMAPRPINMAHACLAVLIMWTLLDGGANYKVSDHKSISFFFLSLHFSLHLRVVDLLVFTFCTFLKNFRLLSLSKTKDTFSSTRTRWLKFDSSFLKPY